MAEGLKRMVQRDGNGGVNISSGALRILVPLLVLAITGLTISSVANFRVADNARSIENNEKRTEAKQEKINDQLVVIAVQLADVNARLTRIERDLKDNNR